jgi:hypothetical protein
MAHGQPEPRPRWMEEDDVALLRVVEANLRYLAELRAKGRSTPARRPAWPVRIPPAGRLRPRPAEMEPLVQKQARVVLLDTRCHVLDVVLVYQGSVNSTSFRPAELLRDAVILNAPSLVLVHNHPSGDPEPSPPDIALTKELVRAGKLLGIEVADHVVVGRDAFVSLKERKLLG